MNQLFVKKWKCQLSSHYKDKKEEEGCSSKKNLNYHMKYEFVN